MRASRLGLGIRVGDGLVDLGLTHAWIAFALTALAVGLGAGCGGGGGAIPVDDIPARVEAAYCQRAAACAGGPEISVCESSLAIDKNSNLLLMVAAVKRGTIVYDGVSARECLDDFASGCFENQGAPAACAETFRGAVAAGGACQLSQECISGTCNRSCGDACCAGTCAVGEGRVVVGGACAGDGVCVDGAYCKNGKCAAELALGAACAAGDVCRSPGQCSAASGSAGTCVAAPAEGASCSGMQICSREDNYCEPTTQVCTRRKPAGSACSDPGIECAALAPCHNNVCTPLPMLGQPCDQRCFGDLVCTQGTCAVAPAPTTSCAP